MTEPLDKSPDLSQYDALVISVAVTTAFESLDLNNLSMDLRAGAVLLYDQIMQRVKPLLPPGMDTIEAVIEKVGRAAATVRRVNQLPPRL